MQSWSDKGKFSIQRCIRGAPKLKLPAAEAREAPRLTIDGNEARSSGAGPAFVLHLHRLAARHLACRHKKQTNHARLMNLCRWTKRTPTLIRPATHAPLLEATSPDPGPQ